MAPVATGSVPPIDRISAPSSSSGESIEETSFSSALVCLEGHHSNNPPMAGPKTQVMVTSIVTRTLEKTHSLIDVRDRLSNNVEIWIYLTKIFAAAVPSLNARSVGPIADYSDADKALQAPDSTTLIIKNYLTLKEDLQMLNKLMHIARNLLAATEPEVPQDISASVSFDQMVYQTIIVCVNVTSKHYDGDVLDEGHRGKLNEVNDLYKKLLVTSLQQAHNWTTKNDRNKMSFWLDVLFDNGSATEEGDGTGFRPDIARMEVQNWLERNSTVCDKAKQLLQDYVQTHENKAPGIPTPLSEISRNWVPGNESKADGPQDTQVAEPQWLSDAPNKCEQDKAWGRVSHEVDKWWERARDQNFDQWNVAMPSKELAQARHETFMGHIEQRFAPGYHQPEPNDVIEELPDTGPSEDPLPEEDDNGSRSLVQDYVDELNEEDDLDDNDSYGEGPMTGLLTDIPNILDPKQIEALHMTVKACILDNKGSSLTRFGENLHKTRCRMFLALDGGRSLLREILVFIAVWEKEEQSLIFDITTNIVEALHEVALVPYAWDSLRIPKDVVSPAQTVMLRLINHMFHKRYLNVSPLPAAIADDHLDIKLIHYLFSNVRNRIVPECLAFMKMQGEIRREDAHPSDFPVDNWDMDRAREGLVQVLQFLLTISEIDDMRAKLVEWAAAYELISLLRGLEDAVPRKQLVDAVPKRAAKSSPPTDSEGAPYSQAGADQPPPPPPPPPPQEPAHKFPWAGIKLQILAILANLLQPEVGKTSPGNPTVQAQIMMEKGIVPLLNCCAFDDHNQFARERVQICLKYLMDGSEDANNFLRELVRFTPPPTLSDTPGLPTRVRVDGIEGEVNVVKKAPAQQGPAPVQQAKPVASGAADGSSSKPEREAASSSQESDRPLPDRNEKVYLQKLVEYAASAADMARMKLREQKGT